MSKEEVHMQRCLELARLGAGHVSPNPLVGAVLLHDNRIIGEGYHQQYGQPHAEVNCINSVKKEDEPLLQKSTIYVSLEPCAHFGKTPPCADLIIRKRIPKIVVGCRDPFEAVNGKGIEKLLYAGLDVTMSTLDKACIFLNRRFFTFHKKKRPYILLKWAQTADGSIAYQNQAKNDRLYISNDICNRLVHQWRSQEAAILVGTRTATLDNPSLTNRLWTGRRPIRLAIDKNLTINKNNALYNSDATTILFTKKEKQNEKNIQFHTIKNDTDYIDEILQYGYNNNIQSILVEGGTQLLQSFIDRGLWDEARIITNEHLMVKNGLKAPTFGHTLTINQQHRLDNNRVDIIYHQHLDAL
ncbi:MAG: bifunctional diaminohydroxyphosphoribosylaminopyrimidine deaminase/5-amino-6-(5-phosphoribosylamino)uracil reductase RibD [Chitinophagaceae bacterium]